MKQFYIKMRITGNNFFKVLTFIILVNNDITSFILIFDDSHGFFFGYLTNLAVI